MSYDPEQPTPERTLRWPWYLGGVVIVAMLLGAAVATGVEHSGPAPGGTAGTVTAPLTSGDPGSPPGH